MYSEFANKGWNCVCEGQYLPFKTRCLPLSALCSCSQDNPRNSYQLPAGLILKLHPFSEEWGEFNLSRIRWEYIYGFYVYIDFIQL